MTAGWSAAAFGRIAGIVAKRAGLIFPENRRSSAEAAMRRAMAALGEDEPERYAADVEGGGAVLDALLAELTVGESYFFREPAQLDFVVNVAAPSFDGPPDRTLRVWSAACAAGEEPYSLAILLRERHPELRARILGTDVSRPRLAAARRGHYRRWALRGVPPAIVERYFRHRGDEFILDPTIREAVRFQYLNLRGDDYPSTDSGVRGMDVVLCRNALIYLDDAAIEHVGRQLLASLSERGWLFLGASDPPLANYVPCDVVTTGAGVAYRRASRRGRRWRTRSGANPEPPRTTHVEAGAPAAARTTVPEPASPPSPALPPAPESPAALAAGTSATPTRPESARAAYVERDYVRAARLADDAVQAGDGRPGTDVLLVRALANGGRLTEAGLACAAALDRFPADAELMYLHALLLSQAGRAREAAAAARRALYLDPSLAVAHLLLGGALARSGDTPAARRALRSAERLLADLPADAPAPAADGETAGRLCQLARAQRELLGSNVA